jgi:L-rhamnose mutarotase
MTPDARAGGRFRLHRQKGCATMERACFVMQLHPGQQDEYERRHDEIWPAMVDALRTAGFSIYTLFRRGDSVYAYVECHPDRATAFAAMAATDVDQRWQEWMSDVIKSITDDEGDLFWADEVWHMD